jgi:hypothetical protein
MRFVKKSRRQFVRKYKWRFLLVLEFAFVLAGGIVAFSLFQPKTVVATPRATLTSAALVNTAVTRQVVFRSDAGVFVRWNDPEDWYRADINGQSLRLEKDVHGVVMLLASMPFQAVVGESYILRLAGVGHQLSAKAWPAGETEPNSWMLQAQDATFPTGRSGIVGQ